jgi:ATP synthase protein I
VKNQSGLRGARRLLAMQAGMTLALASALGIFGGVVWALSAMLGGGICVLPNALFAQVIFSEARASASQQIMRRFYRGEALKITVSMILFAATFRYVKIIPSVFFIAYLVVQLTHWAAPWIFVKR